MDNENVVSVAETLARSMDDTQRNATDTKDAVGQVLNMTGKDMHDKTVSAILAERDLGIAEKLELIHYENADYDQRQQANAERVARLQDARTQNVGRATAWWSENWGWVAFVCAIGLAISTPQGRKLLASAARSLAA